MRYFQALINDYLKGLLSICFMEYESNYLKYQTALIWK